MTADRATGRGALAARLDAVTVEQLRVGGGLSWSLHPDALGSFVAETDFGTAPAVTAALHAEVDAARTGYLPPWMARGMAQAYCDFSARRYGWAPEPDAVRPTADVISGLGAVVRHLTRPGSAVVLPTPAYMPFLTVPATLGRETVLVPCRSTDGRYELDLDAIDAAFAAGAGLLVLTNPWNPVGRVLSRAELLAVSEVVEARGGRVLADEIHAPLVLGGHRHVPYASVSDAAAAHSVTATSASKAWNVPGLKCAQLVLTAEADRRTWQDVGHLEEHGAGTPGVAAATAAYTDGEAWLADVLAYLEGNRALLVELLATHLPAARHRPPEGTYLAWVDCRATRLPELAGPDAGAWLREHAGVALVDGPRCGPGLTGFVRLNLATPAPVLEQVVERLGRALG